MTTTTIEVEFDLGKASMVIGVSYRYYTASLSARSPEDNSKRINKRATPISNKSELKSMVLTRFRMEKWCHAPFFADVAKGAFVRINIGQNNGVPVYRVRFLHGAVLRHRFIFRSAKFETLSKQRKCTISDRHERIEAFG